MSKYKAGEKFVIEIEKPIEFLDGGVMYEFKGITSWLRESDVDTLGQLVNGVDQYSRMKGQQEAWELAQQIASGDVPGCYNPSDFYEIFNTYSVADAQTKYTYAEAAAKVEAWNNNVRVGDVVKAGELQVEMVVIAVYENNTIWTYDLKPGSVAPLQKFTHTILVKTGRHIDIEAVLDQIGEENECTEI